MGAGVSVPIDQERVKEITEKTTAEFTGKYAKVYPAELLKKTVADAKGSEGGPAYELLSRPEAAKSKDPVKTGWMTKEGAVVRNWKKRFFVVRYDYKIEYYDSEETFKSGGSPKGTINPAGYKVVANPEGELVRRVEELAKKLKVDVSSLSKPSTPPGFAVGLMKKGQRDWYIQFESEAQKQEWLPVLAMACNKAEGLNSQDPVTRAAFKKAYTYTRYRRGYYGYWNFDSSEEQLLSDLIARQLNDEVLGAFYDKIDESVGNAKLRSMVNDKVEGTIATTVGGAVGAGWNGANRGMEQARPPVEAKLKENVGKIVEAEKSVSDKAVDSVSGVVDPVAARVAAPATEAALPSMMGPITAALKELIAVFTLHSAEADKSIAAGQNESQVWRDLASLPRYYSTLRDAEEKLDKMRELLSALEKFPQLRFGASEMEGVVRSVLEFLQALLDKAFYTLQHLFGEKVKGGADKAAAVKDARDETHRRLTHDCKLALFETVKSQLLTVVLPSIREEVLEPCKSAMDPVTEAIPDFLKSIMDPDDILDETITKIVGNAVGTIVSPALPEF